MVKTRAQRCMEIRRPLVDLQTSHARMAEEMAQLRMEMMAEEMAQLRKEIRRPLVDLQTSHLMMAEEMAQLRKEMMSMRRSESPDSDVSLKSDGSKVEPIYFKDRVSPRWGHCDSDVSAVENFNKLLDDQARHEPGAVV